MDPEGPDEWKEWSKELDFVHEYYFKSEHEHYFNSYKKFLEALIEESESIELKVSYPTASSPEVEQSEDEIKSRIGVYSNREPETSEYSYRELVFNLFKASKTTETYKNPSQQDDSTGLALIFQKEQKENLKKIIKKMDRPHRYTIDSIEFTSEGLYCLTWPVSTERYAIDAVYIKEEKEDSIERINRKLSDYDAKLVREN